MTSPPFSIWVAIIDLILILCTKNVNLGLATDCWLPTCYFGNVLDFSLAASPQVDVETHKAKLCVWDFLSMSITGALAQNTLCS